MNILKKKERRLGRFLFKPTFLKNTNKSSKRNRMAPKSRAEVVMKVGLIEANEKGIVSIKRGRRLAIKIAKKPSLIEVTRVTVKKHADHVRFLCDSDEFVSCYPDQSIVQFIAGKNIEFTVER